MTATIPELPAHLQADYGEHKVTRIGGIIAVSLFSGMTLASVAVLVNDLISHKPDPAMPPLAWCLVAVLFGTLAVLCSYFVGPNHIHFDFAERSYSLKRGFPFVAKTFTGPVDDIAELYLKEFRGKGGIFWHLMAGWKHTQRSPFRLLVCDDLPTIQEQMASLAESLGVPQDPKPRS